MREMGSFNREYRPFDIPPKTQADPRIVYRKPQHSSLLRNKHRLFFPKAHERPNNKPPPKGREKLEPIRQKNQRKSPLYLDLTWLQKQWMPLPFLSPKRAKISTENFTGICFVLRSDLQSHNYPGNLGLMLPKISR